MAATIAAVSGPAGVESPGGQVRRAFFKVTFDASYPTGGYAVKAASFGLLYQIVGINTNPSSAAHLVVWDDVNSKLQVFTAQATEVTSTTDLHTVTCNVEVAGF